jgi:threonine aldolase
MTLVKRRIKETTYVIDLRSDTLTNPTGEMLQSILSAEFGDDGRRNAQGKGEDPTVNKLLDLAAEVTGKEAATFVPSGTMGNMLALLSYCTRGEKAATAECLHIYRSEKASFTPQFCGIIPEFYQVDKFGVPVMESLDEALKKDVKVICIENTNNFCGGTCIGLREMGKIQSLAQQYDIAVHLDGARIFNAASALGVDVGTIASRADSVMFCISKGPGAPAGSLLCGDAPFVRRAAELAKVFGGVMRQAGVLAAPGIIALRDAYETARRDNRNARRIAEQLASSRGKLRVDLETVQTNIVRVYVSDSGKNASEVLDDLRLRGLKASDIDIPDSFRLVLHRGVTDEGVAEGGRILADYSRNLRWGD